VAAILSESLEDQIVSAQASDGSFPSLLVSGNETSTDYNACITGLVARALGGEQLPDRLHRTRERALDYLETCEKSAMPGAFGFWPESSHRMKAIDPPGDADDSAIVAIELYRHGRRSREWLKRIALRVLMPFRVQASEEVRPEWIRVGAFLTWLRPSPANVVDSLVNANVAALFALAGLRQLSAYSDAVAMVHASITWTAGSAQRARLVAPYYPDTGEFYRTLDYAVGCGAVELKPTLALVEQWFGTDTHPEEHRPVCSAPYGDTVWTAPVLQWARRMLPSETIAASA
jgi:hypothetical protein